MIMTMTILMTFASIILRWLSYGAGKGKSPPSPIHTETETKPQFSHFQGVRIFFTTYITFSISQLHNILVQELRRLFYIYFLLYFVQSCF